MGSLLFEHNRNAYEAAVEMMETTGRAAVIHPTGTGKSFLAFQLCADHVGENVCWLSPSEYIFATQEEKWQRAGGNKLENIRFFTYAKLMRMGEETLAGLNPSYIVLDEFHRCGATQWGGGVKRLQRMYPQAKILGLSATNIRYLDNQRDMALELFGGSVASELTLGAAIVQGILPVPKYVLSVYSYRKELERYRARVRRTKNKAVRDKAQKEFEALRRALKNADGLDKVFARHMLDAKFDYNNEKLGLKEARSKDLCRAAGAGTTRLGKYIVFCANFNHLMEMKALAAEWFAGVDRNPHIYTAYSDDPKTAQEFEAFQADKSTHLKLLYCIDMLNEGIHVDGVDGVILLRPTVSPTIYKQQVGRALSAGGKTPVIFDIVMNIENLCSIGALEEELREAAFVSCAKRRGDGTVGGHFQIIDEVKDCRRLFEQLNETLAASWDTMYAMAKEYYKIHGNLEVPAAYITADGYSLGAWVATQRKVYQGRTAGCLSMEQARRLETIGMRWQGVRDAMWERNFCEAEKYFKEHGNLQVPADYVTGGGCRLGRWVRRQREQYRGWVQQNAIKEKGSDRNGIDTAKSLQENPGTMENGKGTCLDTEITVMAGKTRMRASREKLWEERVKKLTQIGMMWETDDAWERRFELAREYYKEHGNLRMAADYIVEGVWLNRWLREQKASWEEEVGRNTKVGKTQGKKAQKKSLTQEQKEKLASIGLAPGQGVSKAELSWREQYGEAKEFYQEHGNLSVPKRYIAGNGKKLGVWLQHQRTNKRNGVLANWQVCLLDGIGMVWEMEDSWEQGFLHAKEYFRLNGHLAVPNNYVCKDGYRLGRWISNQRFAYCSTSGEKLSGERIRQMETIGMVWRAKRGRRGDMLSENKWK
ncbi:MAG: Helicase associated domain protein [Lachnospiraceae bacterium]|nr:Helicase associated domain protein [Lachnospiraceae bacterium]